jgi:hypothetical protein
MRLDYWKNQTVSERIRAFYCSNQVMTPDQKQSLKAHLQAIAQILYDDSDPATLKTLEGIEMTLRQQIQTHVSPELGNFLSKQLQERKQANSEP